MDLLNLFVKIGVKDEASEAVEGVSQNIIGKLGKAAATAAKALAGAFAVKKVVDFGKAAFDSYAQFQQLEGGVSKLFGDSAQTVMDNASKAFSGIGISANEYMSQVTSFSAALISDLGGNTSEAAELSNTAMKSMADNVSIFGSDMESVQNAYQGFAKQQYNMLDNLRLGYGGTKSEMERLIADANEYAASIGQASDLSIDSFADVVQAIDLIQQKQGIAGNAAAEASKTIEGSMNATKAAWQNLVTEFGKPDADIGARISDMFTAVFGENGEGGLLRNVTNEAKVIASNVIGAVSDGISAGVEYIRSNGPKLVADAMQRIASSIGNASDWLANLRENVNLVDIIFGDGGEDTGIAGKIGEFVSNMASTIQQNWPQISSALSTLWDEVVATAETYGPQIMEVAGRLLQTAGEAIAEHGPEIAAKVSQLLQDGLNAVGKLVGMAAAKGAEFIGGLITGSSNEGKKLHEWFANFFPDGLLKGLGDFATFLLDCGRALINGLLDGIGEVAPDVENAIRGAFQKVLDFFNGVGEFIKDPIGSIQKGLGDLVGAYDATSEGVDENMGRVEGSVDRAMTNAGKSLGKYNGVKLNDKKASATVSGNAQDGKAKSSVEDTKRAVDNLSGKSVTVSASGNIITGVAKAAIENVRGVIDKLRDKTVNVTTNQKTVVSGPEKANRARGGIRKHARGDIMVANNPVQGVPLDIVGEAGPEAIVPLTSRYGKEFAQIMGREAGKFMEGGSSSVNIYMTYDASADAKTIVMDMAHELEILGLTGA